MEKVENKGTALVALRNCAAVAQPEAWLVESKENRIINGTFVFNPGFGYLWINCGEILAKDGSKTTNRVKLESSNDNGKLCVQCFGPADQGPNGEKDCKFRGSLM